MKHNTFPFLYNLHESAYFWCVGFSFHFLLPAVCASNENGFIIYEHKLKINSTPRTPRHAVLHSRNSIMLHIFHIAIAAENLWAMPPGSNLTKPGPRPAVSKPRDRCAASQSAKQHRRVMVALNKNG